MAFVTLAGMRSDGQVALTSLGEDRLILCYTDSEHRIREMFYNHGQWSGGQADKAVVHGDRRSPLAMLTIKLTPDVRGIRTYYMIGDHVKETCCDGTPDQFAEGRREWFDGALTMSRVQAPSSSKLASVIGRLHESGDGPGAEGTGRLQHLVVYQDTSLGLQAQVKVERGEWNAGGRLPVPPSTHVVDGTGLAAVWKNGAAHVYFQCDDGFVYEASRTDGAWSLSKPLFKAKVGTPMAAVIPSSGTIHVFHANDANVLSFAYKSSQGWGVDVGNLAWTVLEDSSLAVGVVLRQGHREDFEIFYARESDGLSWKAVSPDMRSLFGEAPNPQFVNYAREYLPVRR
ncbi:uncharacterized protein BKCO1_4800044 [Diplodia corticola]|uniref:Uncharacterized protein n=1 Tax=Diplodia corticola TaxID=236234 RepID=A0A1J9RFZ8_9PEZI|nr:uncharacterized protein BKCO1_4800044 [Diplodia corticola]OJD31467.1 hypothetical protein BKCO1_4800044 [Diplodia corticola]